MREVDQITRRGVAHVSGLSQVRQAQLTAVWAVVVERIHAGLPQDAGLDHVHRTIDAARSAFLRGVMDGRTDFELPMIALAAVGIWNPMGLTPP